MARSTVPCQDTRSSLDPGTQGLLWDAGTAEGLIKVARKDCGLCGRAVATRVPLYRTVLLGLQLTVLRWRRRRVNGLMWAVRICTA